MALEAIADIAANVAPTSPYEAVFDFAVDLSFEIGGWPGRLVSVALTSADAHTTPTTTTTVAGNGSRSQGLSVGSVGEGNSPIVTEYVPSDAGSVPGPRREMWRSSEATRNPAPMTEVEAALDSLPTQRPLWSESVAEQQFNERHKAKVAEWVEEMSAGRCVECAKHKNRMVPGHDHVTELLRTIKDRDPRPILIEDWIKKLSVGLYRTPFLNVEQLLVKAEERMKRDSNECNCTKCKYEVARMKKGSFECNCSKCGKNH